MSREKKAHLKQRKDGRYCAIYQGIQFMGNTEEEALRLRQQYKDAEARGEIWLGNSPKVTDYALKWLPIHRASVSKNTYNSYVNYMNVLCMKIGEKEMASVTPSDIKSVYNCFLDMSESTIRKARMLYVDLWDSAIEDGVARVNPCRSKTAKPHKGTEGTHRALTEEEDSLILWAPAELRLAVLVMRYAGLRRGEALALDIDRDVDFQRKIITVSQAIRFTGNKGEVVDPKTEAGKREIPLLNILEKELKGHHGLLMPSASGVTMSSSAWKSAWSKYKSEVESFSNNCNQKRWYHLTKEWISEHQKEYLEYARLKQKNPNEAEKLRLKDWKSFTVRPHDLRHSFCTMCRDNDVDLRLCISWMGHADEKMVLRIYDHQNEKRAARAIDRLNTNIRPAGFSGD